MQGLRRGDTRLGVVGGPNQNWIAAPPIFYGAAGCSTFSNLLQQPPLDGRLQKLGSMSFRHWLVAVPNLAAEVRCVSAVVLLALWAMEILNGL